MTSWSRREFMGGVAALLACGDNSDPGRFGGFDMAIQSWTFRTQNVDDALASIASLGITRVELSPQAGHFGYPATDDQIAAMRAKLASYGLDCVTTGLEPVGADPNVNRAIFDYARAFGLRTIMVDPPYEILDDLEQLVKEYDIRIGIHNHGPGTRYDVIGDVQAALAGRDPRIGCVIDLGHYTRAGVDPVRAIYTFSDRVYGIHVKDVAAAEPGAPDTILGEGVVNFPRVFRALRAIRFRRDCSLSLEYEGNPGSPYNDVVACLKYASDTARAAW